MEAEKVAGNFYTERFLLTQTFKAKLLSYIQIKEGKNGYFVFNFKENKGFIIVSGNDNLPPILGYSFDGNFEQNYKNEAFGFWMNCLNNLSPSEVSQNKYKNEWIKYLTNQLIQEKGTKAVTPLLSIAWGQACYYNALCPIDSAGSCYHARTGCGATAMAMIMKYWDFPAHGFGSNSYENPPYGTISANFENTFYDWQNMPPQLNSLSDSIQINAVAELMYHCGVAVNMVYTTNASSSDNWNIRNAFTDNFDYSSESQFIDKSDFPDSVWTSVMKDEADNGRPVFYGISSGSGGHFVVLDGYQDDDYFHFNWGYGNLNGYYKTFDELPIIQQAIINLKPNNDTITGFKEFYAYNGLFNDGSNHLDYPYNKTYKWFINPNGAESVVLLFTKFATGYKTDFVNIYDGETTASPLLGSFSGHNLPPVIETSANKALVEFITNDSITDIGWELRYTTTRNSLACSGISVFTDSTGNFEDGSSSANYIDNADCFYLIKPDTASSINLHFDNFYTETDWDFLYVYDGENPAQENLLAVLTGHIYPGDIQSTKGAVLLHFHSDWNTNRPGWEVSYTTNYDRINLDLKVFLEGPFMGTVMNTEINELIPLNQPFDTNPSAVCYYEGTESVDSIPNADVVDWVLIEIRDATDVSLATPESIRGQQAVFLLSNGSIVDINGSNPKFNYRVEHQCYISIFHRNHLAVISANPITEVGGIYSYDFSTTASQAYSNGQKEIVTGVWGMIAGDADASGLIDWTDKSGFWDIRSGSNGFLNSDMNLDAEVNNLDKNDFWLLNINEESQVPQ